MWEKRSFENWRLETLRGKLHIRQKWPVWCMQSRSTCMRHILQVCDREFYVQLIMGITKTKQRLRGKVWWPKIDNDGVCFFNVHVVVVSFVYNNILYYMYTHFINTFEMWNLIVRWQVTWRTGSNNPEDHG